MLIKKILGLICFSSFAFVSGAEVQNSQSNKDLNEKIASKKTQRSSLFEALSSALKNNKEILSAQNELMAIHENHVSVASSFRPKVSLNTQYQADSKKSWYSNKNDWDTNLPSSKAYTKSYGIGVKQNIFHGFSDVAALKETDLNIKAKWSEYENKKQTILRNIAISYFAIIAKKEEINHLKSLLSARKENIEVAKEMHETGATKYLDVAQAKASYAETESKLAKSEAEYVSYSSQFEEMTGYKTPEKLTAPEKLFDENMSEKQAIDLAIKNNPGISVALNALLAAKLAVKKINPEFTPSLDASYSFDQSYNHSSKNLSSSSNKYNNKGHTFSLALSVPIYDGGSARAEKRKYIELATKAAVDKEKTIEETKTQVISILAALRAAKQSLISARAAVEARELALHDTEEEYKAGIKIMKDVLEAQEQLFEARYMEIQAENDYFSNQCKANALIGRMDARYLKIADTKFSYKNHFRKTSKKL